MDAREQQAVPDRRQRILAPLGDLTRVGLEIGALHHPIIDRSQDPNANVLYVDHTDTAALHAKYADDTDVGEMVAVDVVWGDGLLVDAIGDRAPIDWVIASHVIEHVPNLVGWLDELASVMSDGAVLSLAIPDKRYCFDINRRETDPSDVVGAWLADSKRPSLATVYEFYARIAPVDAGQAWAGVYALQPAEEDVERGLEWARKAADSDEYVDVHCWTFTPDVFVATLRTLFRLGLTSFRVVRFTPTLSNELEFFCALERLPRSLAPDQRMEAQLASLPVIDRCADGLDDGTHAMVLSGREVRLIEAKRRAATAVRKVLDKVRRQ
jgi:hypothetical protein